MQWMAPTQANGRLKIPAWRTRRSRYYPCRPCATTLPIAAGPLRWQALTWKEGWCWVEPPSHEASVWWLEFQESHPHRRPVDRISAMVDTNLTRLHNSPWAWLVRYAGSRWGMRGEESSIDQALRCAREAIETCAPVSAQRRLEICTRLQATEADAARGPVWGVSRLHPPRRDKPLAITRRQMGIVAPNSL